ncbi:centriole and centriolar satellite protein OFD1-like [Saccoglossus kowalevskii]|uniref:Oral-facial-digital syndrome 1 protein-like n=1 Tax=Saccoglossus kowalevskii TaxID=10224 RepID=A0ABM0M5N4_SACKO|nr:PREDICTED: oral-facial-digital syndrome 1 protein-like [Saccoglossus kowalevskii]
MLSPEQEELSAEELKSKLFHSFREKGVLDSLKSQLRNRLITELSHGGITGKIPRHVSVKDESLMLRASNSILADHLRRCHYDYTLSVFLPESGTGQDKLFTVRDLLQLLQINPQSKLFKDLSSSITTFTNESFLWQLLTQLASRYQGGCHDKSLQTEGPPVCFTSLDDKLDCVEQAYSNKLDNNELGGSLEERLMSHRRQIEAQARTDVNAEILRFKENDLARVKLEEREKARKEIEQSRKEMERTYQIKSDALGERERHSLERLQKEREIMEKETFIQRQKVLEELDSLRVREATVRREADLNAKAVKIEEDRRRAIEDNLRKREAAVARIEETYEHQLTEKMASYDLEQKSKYITRLQSLEISEARNKEETRLLAEERARVNLAREDLKEKTARCKQLEVGENCSVVYCVHLYQFYSPEM